MNAPIDVSNVVIQTSRLILRPWRQTDLDDFYEYASVDGVGQMAGWHPHRSKEESRTILNHFVEGKHVFALEYQGKVIGSLGVEEYSCENHPQLEHLQGREIGYVLSKAYWGQGLMPEAVNRVVNWLFDDVGLDFVICGHFDHNLRSRRVIEKCGFQYIKTVKFQTRLGTTEDALDYIRYRRSE